MILGTRSIMQEIDRTTINDYKVPGTLLMEHAAIEVTKVIDGYSQIDEVIVVCGTGNNGGDGFAIARLCYLKGYKTRVYLVGQHKSIYNDAKVMYDMINALEIPLTKYSDVSHIKRLRIREEQTLIVDALFGIGCNRPLDGIYEDAVNWMNQTGKRIISVDIPSGIDCDTGRVLNVAVQADVTVTFTIPKIGLHLKPGKYNTGTVMVVPIGVPQRVLELFQFDNELIDVEVLDHLPSRQLDSHKYTYGKILVVAGSSTMPGACVLAALSAYRTGTGLVEVLTHRNGLEALMKLLPEAIVHVYDDDAIDDVLKEIKPKLETYVSILIGPGIGLSQTSHKLMAEILKVTHCPVVIDADAITLVSAYDVDKVIGRGKRVMTPHLGELARLSARSIDHIKDNLVEVCQEVSRQYHCIVIAKSDATLVVSPEGYMCINGLGNSGMATAGSGDVLAGVLTSLIGQNMYLYEACVTAVALHSLAGDLAAGYVGEAGLIASDMIRTIGKIIDMQGETVE